MYADILCGDKPCAVAYSILCVDRAVIARAVAYSILCADRAVIARAVVYRNFELCSLQRCVREFYVVMRCVACSCIETFLVYCLHGGWTYAFTKFVFMFLVYESESLVSP